MGRQTPTGLPAHPFGMWWIGLLCLGALFGLASWGAGKMVYYPMRYPGGNWEVRDTLGATDVWLRASDGTRVHAWWIAAQAGTSGPVTLHLHGNAGNITHRDLTARHIVKAGSSVLLLDYRGYGRSEGKPGEQGLYRDAAAAYDWIMTQGFRPEQIVLHGESLGSGVAVNLASTKPCAGVVLEAPFTSIGAVAGKVVPVLGPLLVRGYDSLSRIRNVRVPVLIVHGETDEIIPYAMGQRLFEAANEPKQVWSVQEAGHNALHITGGPEFAARLRAFYASLPTLRRAPD